MNTLTLRPDAKGRIFLGKLAEGVSSFKVTRKNHCLILEPYVEIPLSESWLLDHPDKLKHVREGIQQSANGDTQELGSFAQYT
jgi:aminopeptidase-like protein